MGNTAGNRVILGSAAQSVSALILIHHINAVGIQAG